ncbi:MAG: PCYCGC motif-containing (lipo)protein [Candidatus Methylomirabilales bacterium]
MKESKTYEKRCWEHSRRVITAVVVGGSVILGIGMVGWTGQAPQAERARMTASGDRLHRVPVGDLPAFVVSAPSSVQRAYLYAAGHPEGLRYIPCFCGCTNIGHRHNADCYVHERHVDGTITFTSHGAT